MISNILSKRRSIKVDLIITFINGLAVILGIIFLNGYISRLYGLEVLGEFLLLKNTFTTIAGTLMIGLNVGLPYYLSKHKDNQYGFSAFGIIIIITLPLSIILLLILQNLNINGFDNNYFWLYLLYLNSIILQILTFALYRGHFNALIANLIQLSTTALIPTIVFTLAPDLHTSLAIIGGSVTLISLIAYASKNGGLLSFKNSIETSKNLLRYGIWRIPGFIAQFILLALIPIILARWSNLSTVAYFNSSLSIVKLVVIFINPITIVLLPHFSEKIVAGKQDELSSNLNILFRLGIVSSTIVTAFLFLNATILFQLWLGDINENSINVIRTILVVIPFFTIAGLARSPINAASEKGYSSIVYGLGAVVMVLGLILGYVLGWSIINSSIISFIAGHMVTGMASLNITKRFFKVEIFSWMLILEIIMLLFCILTLKLLTSYLLLSGLVQIIVSVIAISIITILYISYSTTEWTKKVRQLVIGFKL